MGIIKAGVGAISGGLADQWLETIEPDQINNSTLASFGVKVRKDDKRSSNRKGTQDVISNGSVIHVPENTFMLLVDGGKIISATDEPGYYQVDNSRAPSLFFKSAGDSTVEGYGNTGEGSIKRPGGFVNTIKDSWERLKFGGTTPVKQTVIYINKQEIPDIRFGTKNPVPYTDRVLVPGRPVPCKITSFGTYSIKISDPILFYSEVCNKTEKDNLEVHELAEQYINEFLMAYQTALANLSKDMIMVSEIPMKTFELGQYMADTLDDEWLAKRGFYIQSVGIAGINYDEKTDKLLDKYGNDSILLDPNARAARMTAGIAAGMEAAGSNEGGAFMGFAGMGMGMNAAGNMGGVMNPQTGAQGGGMQGQPQQSQVHGGVAGGQPGWTCSCGHTNAPNAAFCGGCGSKKPTPQQEGGWTCSCGASNTGAFCSECGSKKPAADGSWECSCGATNTGKFCSSCGTKKPEEATFKCNKCGWEPEDPKNPPKFCPSCGDPFDMTDRA